MATTSQVTHEINQVLRELVAARDEARVRAHLLSLDARERLSDLEKEIENFERKLSARGDWITEHVVATARGLTRAVSELVAPRARHDPACVRDVMCREPRTCLPSDSLNVAAQQMWECDCGALPVVDHDGRAVGMLTDRDICMSAYTSGRALADIAVSSAMSNHVFTCRPGDSLRQLMSSMATHQVRRVPVVDEADKVIGIVALADLARLAQAPTALSHEARVWVPGMLAGISAKPGGQPC
jgi:CBS domain-containing protein